MSSSILLTSSVVAGLGMCFLRTSLTVSGISLFTSSKKGINLPPRNLICFRMVFRVSSSSDGDFSSVEIVFFLPPLAFASTIFVFTSTCSASSSCLRVTAFSILEKLVRSCLRKTIIFSWLSELTSDSVVLLTKAARLSSFLLSISAFSTTTSLWSLSLSPRVTSRSLRAILSCSIIWKSCPFTLPHSLCFSSTSFFASMKSSLICSSCAWSFVLSSLASISTSPPTNFSFLARSIWRSNLRFNSSTVCFV
mmetsp:Transcript_27096/g.43003  ORF Transcript_27096/g.43003 Transcript_27096/m.43003 type:complete len:251 (-) Transcript_27096:1237-1989(-)